MKGRWHIVILLLSIVVVMPSCSSKKRLEAGKPLKKRAPGFLINKNAKEAFTYDWLGMKISADFTSEGQSESFKVNVKGKKDSVLWISISPALGIEVIRMIITPDSVKYVSKVPNNKHYYTGTYNDVAQLMGLDIEFSQMMELLVGNPVMLDKQDDKLESLVDDRQYFMVSKFSRRLKKLLDVDERQILPNTTLTVNSLSKDYRKIKKRSSVEDLMVKRFWLSGEHYKLERAQFDDLYNLRIVELGYRDFKEYEGQLYPSRGRLKVSDQSEWQQLEFKITRVRTGKEYEFPFEIPKDFERRRNL
jgi:hypothetical protein